MILVCWSTVALEALAFGKQSILIHKTGLDTFHEYIKTGVFIDGTTTQKLINGLSIQPSKDTLKYGHELFETNPRKAVDALNSLLEYHRHRTDFTD